MVFLSYLSEFSFFQVSFCVPYLFEQLQRFMNRLKSCKRIGTVN